MDSKRYSAPTARPITDLTDYERVVNIQLPTYRVSVLSVGMRKWNFRGRPGSGCEEWCRWRLLR
jgi:hypothetical protein